MQLNPKILAVLTELGAEENEISSLTDYFAAQLVMAVSSADQLTANIESLQKQLVEETERANRIRKGIGKFVVPDA
jgi:methyl-accepting chemotaxis protein